MFKLYFAVLILITHAHTCDVGQEHDADHVWRWVLPYDDPCQCTSIIRGGANPITPRRNFKPVYVDKPLFTRDVNKIRKHYDLICLSKNFDSIVTHTLKSHGAVRINFCTTQRSDRALIFQLSIVLCGFIFFSMIPRYLQHDPIDFTCV